MKTENKVLMRQAREMLRGKWGHAIGAYLIYLVIALLIGSTPLIGPVASLILSGPLMLGMVAFFLSFSRGQDTRFADLFKGFEHFGRAMGTYLWMTLFIVLWTLLLIVPGIIAAIAYSQTFFLMADDAAIAHRPALKKSREMMYGYKWKYFCLQLRFLGWALLSILTLGIGFLWLLPYMQVSFSKFYDDLKGASAPA
ncbi:DUF975 family protein [Candidatus Kaiserbacteria bacterium]|nr:DUF975 family protein [Candidatus Kaiserbacteria bacterium]